MPALPSGETTTEVGARRTVKTSSFNVHFATMFKLCLQRAALRPAVQKLPSGRLRLAPPGTAPRLPGIGRHTPSCCLGTHGRNEPREPLNSPKRAKEFIYRLQPKERTCLLKELQSFESIAIAQGKTGGALTLNEKSQVRDPPY